MKQRTLAFALTAALAAPLAQAAFVLPGTGYVQYGDAQSYSLPLLAYLYDQANGGTIGTGPGNPYYVVSTPGAIKDLTVIGTGASGQPVNTNYAGMDDAYPTPNASGIPFFSTGTTTDPGQTSPFTGDRTDTWDATVGALKTFLSKTGGGYEDMIFFFNNNQENSGGQASQSLAAWALIQVIDYSGESPVVRGTYEFTNNGQPYKLFTEGGGGVPNGNVTTFTSSKTLGDNPLVGGPDKTDFVLSGGALCLLNTGALIGCGTTPPSGTTVVKQFDHNLGANQAAYALVFPELNALLISLFNDTSKDLSKITMSMDVRLGCQVTTNDNCGPWNGYGRSLNNGYEQIFIGKASTVVNVPEPATLALLGLGLLGLGLARRRG